MCGIECFNTITVRALFKDIRNGKLPPKGELLNFVMNYHVVALQDEILDIQTYVL